MFRIDKLTQKAQEALQHTQVLAESNESQVMYPIHLLAALVEAGTERLPGDRRYQHRRRALAEGVRITRAERDSLLALANGAVPAR